jgi:hypothetical protein
MFFIPFWHRAPEKIKAHQLKEAQRNLVEFEASLEYHSAMRDMLIKRIQRLTKDQ